MTKDEFFPMAYIRRQPTICAIPFIVIHMAVREACSSLRYQTEVIVMKAGDTAPPENPKRNLTAENPAKLVGAARHMQTAPQMILQNNNGKHMGISLGCISRVAPVQAHTV